MEAERVAEAIATMDDALIYWKTQAREARAERDCLARQVADLGRALVWCDRNLDRDIREVPAFVVDAIRQVRLGTVKETNDV